MNSWIVKLHAAMLAIALTPGFAVAGTPGYLMRYDVLGLVDGVMHSANAVAAMPDGSVITVGMLKRAQQPGIVIAKLGANGQPDLSFGERGWVVLDHSQSQSATAIAVQPDGRLVIGGWRGRDSDRNFLVARLMPNGAPDAGFGQDGIVVHPLSADGDLVNDIALMPDGRILAVGGARIGSGHDQAAALRLMPDGKPDPDFGRQGVLLMALDTAATTTNRCRRLCGGASSVAILPDGRILLGAETPPADENSLWRSWVVRLLGDGSLDRQFGTKGKIEVFSSSSDLTGSTHVVMQGSRVVVGGGYNVSTPDGRFALVRLTEDGMTDRSFGRDGFVRTPVGPRGAAAGIMTLAVTDDLRLIAAGAADFGEDRGGLQFVVARYTVDGLLDDRFAEGGMLVGGYAPGNGTDAFLSLKTVAGGGFVATGWTQVASGARGLRMGVARYREVTRMLAPGGMAGAAMPTAQPVSWAGVAP